MEIKIESRAGMNEGQVTIAQRFIISEGETPQIINVSWPIAGFEQYLADCYRMLKNVKIKMAEEEQKQIDAAISDISPKETTLEQLPVDPEPTTQEEVKNEETI